MTEYKKKSKLHEIPEQTHIEWLYNKGEDKSHLLKPQSQGVKMEPVKIGKKLLENAVKSKCVVWLKTQGYASHTVYLGGIPIADGKRATNPLKGFPDTIVTNPFAPKGKRLFYVEYKKSSGGVISQEQLNWHALLKACNHKVFVINDIEKLKVEFTAWLNMKVEEV
jgi:hypothetical protein